MDRARAAVKRGRAGNWLAAVPLVLVTLFVAWPVATVLLTALSGRSLEVLSRSSTWRILGYTIGQAVLSSALAVALALPAAYALYRLRTPGRRLQLALLTVPFILPTVVVGLAFRQLLPFPGTTAAIIVAHVFFNVGLVIRVMGSLWAVQDRRLVEVGASLGLAPWTVFRRITLPLLRPALAAATALVFLFTFTSFGVVLVLGDPALPTIEVDIYDRALHRLDLAGAAGIALVQLVVVVAALLVSSRLQHRVSVRQRLETGEEALRTSPRGLGERMCRWYTVALTVLVAVPLLALIVQSLRVGDGWGWNWFTEVLSPADQTTRAVPAGQAIWISVRYAVVATALATGLGLLASLGIVQRTRGRGLLDAALSVPLGVSAVTIGLGLLLASLRGPWDMRTWWMLVPIGQAMVAMPIVIRVIVPILQSVDPRLRQVASTLGAGPVRAWLATEGAVTMRGMGVAAALACAVSLGEFGATAFLVRADTPTVPVQIVRLLGRPGESNLGQAMALSVILMLLTVLIVTLAERIRPASSGGW